MHSGVLLGTSSKNLGVQRTPTYITGKIGGTSSKTWKGFAIQRSSFLQQLFIVYLSSV
jgi:hypothetical protein